MALKQTIERQDNFGIVVSLPNVYIKIVRLEGDKNNLSATVYFYKEPNGEIYTQANYSFEPSLEGNNFIAQAYAYLKTLPEFAGAIDC
jgi:hypothetical protein